MKELSIGTGLVTYSLNGSCEVSFNPTDSAFVEKIYNAFDQLDKRQEGYRAEIDKVGDNREIFQVARRLDNEMREIVNSVFGVDVCGPVFGDMNVYALADGMPLWANLLLSIMDEVDTSFSDERQKMSPKVQRYLDKYQKR